MDHNDRVIRVRATDRLGEFVPLAGRFDPAGFTSPANYYLLCVLDFRELLIENPAATLAMRIDNESIMVVGMFPGDIAVINRAKLPVNGSVVLALVDVSFTVVR